MIFGGLSIHDAIRLYFEKCDAMKRGDLTALREIKNHYPQMFSNRVEQDIILLLDYTNKLRQTPEFQKRYQEFCKDKENAGKNFTLIK